MKDTAGSNTTPKKLSWHFTTTNTRPTAHTPSLLARGFSTRQTPVGHGMAPRLRRYQILSVKLYSTSIRNRTTSSGPEKMAVPDVAKTVMLKRNTRETTVDRGPYWTNMSGIALGLEMRRFTQTPPRSFASRSGTKLATRRCSSWTILSS